LGISDDDTSGDIVCFSGTLNGHIDASVSAEDAQPNGAFIEAINAFGASVVAAAAGALLLLM